MFRKWHDFLDSFTYLNDNDIKWLGKKSRAEEDVQRFPRNCAEMVFRIIGNIIAAVLGFQFSIYLILHSILVLANANSHKEWIYYYEAVFGCLIFLMIPILLILTIKLLKSYFILLKNEQTNLTTPTKNEIIPNASTKFLMSNTREVDSGEVLIAHSATAIRTIPHINSTNADLTNSIIVPTKHIYAIYRCQ
jgi:hypothetical protein